MAIVHIVLFQFKPDVASSVIDDVCRRMLALKTACIHPTTNQPYIKSSVGGIDMSIENLQGGFSHAFVVEFETVEDRDHYVKKDEAHINFVKSLDGIVEAVRVMDFTPGSF